MLYRSQQAIEYVIWYFFFLHALWTCLENYWILRINIDFSLTYFFIFIFVNKRNNIPVNHLHKVLPISWSLYNKLKVSNLQKQKTLKYSDQGKRVSCRLSCMTFPRSIISAINNWNMMGGLYFEISAIRPLACICTICKWK